MFALFGYAGQSIYNILDRRHTASVETAVKQPSLLQRAASSRWSPVTVLSDADYEGMLQEKILKLDVEISLVNDRIAELKQKDASPKD